MERTVDNLNIPDFLDRRNDPPRRTRARAIKRKWKLPKPILPPGKRWKNAKRVTLHISNELPRIGSGTRTVLVIEGRKWCHIAEENGGLQRVATTIYNQIRGD
jgi:hypothetical protein